MNLRYAGLAIVEASITDQSPVANRTIAEIELPVSCAIAAIARGKDIVIPDSDTVIEVGDEIIAVTHLKQEDELRSLLVID